MPKIRYRQTLEVIIMESEINQNNLKPDQYLQQDLAAAAREVVKKIRLNTF
jgi:hypothetical protein